MVGENGLLSQASLDAIAIVLCRSWNWLIQDDLIDVDVSHSEISILELFF
jgi:hypothetical protein